MVGYPFSRCFSPHFPCVFLDTIINFTSGMRPSKWVTTQLRASYIWNIRCVYIYMYIYIYTTLWESKIVGKSTIKPRNSQLCVFVCHRISECRKIPPILQLDWGWWIPDIHWGCWASKLSIFLLAKFVAVLSTDQPKRTFRVENSYFRHL